MCISTELRIVNGRYGRDASVGAVTCITDRSACTIDYMLVDESFTKYINDFQVGDRQESIHMPLILDFQYDFDPNRHLNHIDQAEPSIPTELPPKCIWNADRQQIYIESIRLNLQQISEEFQNTIANNAFDLHLSF